MYKGRDEREADVAVDVGTRTAPGPGRRGSLALVGERRRDALGMFTRLRDRYGEVVRFRMGPLDMLLVSDPDLVQEVFTTHASRVRKGRILEGAKVLLGEGLLTSEGAHHRRQRRLMQPAFHRDRLDAYAGIMGGWAARTAEGWRDGTTVDVFSEMSGLTMGVTGEALFGTDVAGDRERVEAALVDVFRAFDLLVLPFSGIRMRVPSRTVRRFRAAKAELEAMVDDVIARRRAEGDDRGDLLSMLLAARDEEGDGERMTDDEVRHEVMTLFAAGLETTANALAFAWWLLAADPAARAWLEAEADDLPGPPASLADLERLPWTAAVLDEAIRLYPPAWMIARRCVEPFVLGGYPVEEGVLVMTPPWLLHRDGSRWPRALEFDPGRWLDGGGPPHRFSYLPFGAGTRKCIGSGFATAEGVIALATIARTHRLERLPGHALDLSPQITLRPAGGLPMRVEARRAGSLS
ncbi:MAG: cytochrome P450 [Thermoleophilia bacterium]